MLHGALRLYPQAVRPLAHIYMEPRFDYKAIVREVPVPESHTAGQAPYVAVDECFNNEATNRLVVSLCNQGLACGAGPLWNEHRSRYDGSIFYVWGGLSKKESALAESGRATKGVSWDDQMVVRMLLVQLHGGAPVVLLTENTANNQLGLRRLLRKHVGPEINARIADGLSLTTLFKKGKTSYPDYWAGVMQRFQQRQWLAGYHDSFL